MIDRILSRLRVPHRFSVWLDYDGYPVWSRAADRLRDMRRGGTK